MYLLRMHLLSLSISGYNTFKNKVRFFRVIIAKHQLTWLNALNSVDNKARLLDHNLAYITKKEKNMNRQMMYLKNTKRKTITCNATLA